MTIEADILREQAAVLLDVADALDGKVIADKTMAEARQSAVDARDSLRNSIDESSGD